MCLPLSREKHRFDHYLDEHCRSLPHTVRLSVGLNCPASANTAGSKDAGLSVGLGLAHELTITYWYAWYSFK